MKTASPRRRTVAAVFGGLLAIPVSLAVADEPSPSAKPAAHPAAKPAPHRTKASHAIKDEDLPDLNLLEAARNGDILLEAEGTGDGKMNVSVTNATNRPLKVVLPPGLVASGATGQMGGMGGMGGMMGGMGGMGGGMMGGMGGGMGGGMMGGRGGMGGGMMGGRGGMMGGTMPASMGMMTLGRLIMFLVGDLSSWNFRSLMMGGMMGGMGMGGMGMGGMGGGMGGMGMGGMGMMGGGMRSVPPTGLPYAVLQPGQSRRLPTRLVSLGGPTPEGTVAFPAQGEKLTLGDISQFNPDPLVASALRRLAEEKAPTVASQLALWNVSAGLDWNAIAALSKGWASPKDVALARQFVESLGQGAREESGRIFVKVEGDEAVAEAMKGLAKGGSLLGLKVETGIPDVPTGPSLAFTMVVDRAKEKAEVAVKSSTGLGRWVDAGKLTLPMTKKDGKLDVVKLADSAADGILGRVIEARLVKGKKVHGHESYTVQVLNRSPLILNGVALAGAGPIDEKAGRVPGILSGLAVGPGRYVTIGASAETVERLGLKNGVHILAADLSGL